MSDKVNKYELFIDSGCLSLEAIQKYNANELSSGDQHLLERHLLDCPFCSDALEGISEVRDKDKLVSIVDSLKEEVNDLVRNNKLKPVKVLEKKRNLFRKYSYIAIAASVLIFSGVYVVFNKYINNTRDTIVTQKVVPPNPKVSDENKQEKSKSSLPGEELQLPIKSGDKAERKLLDYEELMANRSEANTGKDASGAGYIADLEPAKIKEKIEVIVEIEEESEIAIAPVLAFSAKKNEAISLNGLDTGEEEYVMEDDFRMDDKLALVKVVTKEKAKQSKKQDIVGLLENQPPTKNKRGKKYEKKSLTPLKGGVAKSTSSGSKEITIDQDEAPESEEILIDNKALFEDAMNEYTIGEYSNAIVKYEQLLKDDSNNIKARYYCGLSYLNNDQPEKAAKYFEKVLKSSDLTYSEEAKWYLASSYVKMEEFKPAKVLLDEIIKRKGKYKERAKTVLESME